MQANKYPKNIEGFILLEKLKEQEQASQGFVHYSQMPSFASLMNDQEVKHKKQFDYEEPIPIKVSELQSTSDSSNDASQQYQSPKPNSYTSNLEEPEKNEFIKKFFNKMK